MEILLGPDSVFDLIIQSIGLFPPAAEFILDATQIEFRPRGIQLVLTELSVTDENQLKYSGFLNVDSSAALGMRDMIVMIDQTVLGDPTVIEFTCRDAFSVRESEVPIFFNGPIAFTSPPESPTEPACGCRGEPTYNRGISQIPEGCHSGPSSLISGIGQDAGTATVFLHNGEFNHYVVDLEIPGRGFNWRFERKYRSGITFEGPLGHNWEFNYNRRLFIDPQSPRGDVLRMDGFGRSDLYMPVGGQYVSPTGFYTQLVRNADGTFTERDRAGSTVTYDRPDSNGIGPMTSLTDRNGNTMRFEYNRRSQLIRVIDTLGRPIEYRYNRQGRLIEVEDFFDRSITFEYDRNGNLVAVTSPAVTGTPNGNDFPQGKTERYRYLTGRQLDERLQHNLASITAPNEVESGGPARVTVEYETNTRSPNFDRVMSQMIGGVNQSGVSAGGIISYEYESLETKDGDTNAPIGQTTVTDRNGNVTEYQFNQLGNIVHVREFTNRDIRPSDPEFYETRYEYNEDGELIRLVNPEGNSVEYIYDEANPDRFQQGNILAEVHRPDAARGGDQNAITVSTSYEPIYNQVRTVTGARGNDPSYVPQNGGAASPERYTTTNIFDYQEGENFAALAEQIGLSEREVRTRLEQAGVPMGLGDVNGDGRTDQIAGNLIKTIRPAATLLSNANLARVEGGTRQPIEEVYVHNQFGQMTRRVDPEQNVTLYEYHPENDPDGDGMDLAASIGSGPFGYLKAVTQDAEGSPARNSRTNPPPAAIRTQFFYDRVGNLTKEIDGRGVATEYAFNQLNQVVRIIRAADVTEALGNPEEPRFADCPDPTLVECSAGMTAFRYLTDIFYDFNDNVIRREIENRDSNNRALAGEFVEYTRSYDILDNPVENTREVSENPREVLMTQYRYDRNENRVLTISPVATAGEQPSNVASAVFDERDLLFTSTRGGLTDHFRSLEAHSDIPELNAIPNSPDISTFAHVYDGNRNLKEFIDGADNTGDGRPEVTTYLYDGFDRRVSVIDAVGNQSFINYDPASNIVRLSNSGPVGGPSPRDNRAATFAQPLTQGSLRQPLLQQIEYNYDELSRTFERDNILFDYRTSGVSYVRQPVLQDGPLGGSNDGRVVTRYEYDRNSRLRFVIEDDLSTLETLYDGATRVIRRIDPEQNEVLYTYDDDNNVVKTIEIEITQAGDVQAGRVPNLRETFATINVYDSLNRLIRATDNIGQTRRFHYDSRNNMIFTSDSQHSPDPADLIADPLGLFPVGAAVSGTPPHGSDGTKAGAHGRTAVQINRPGNTTEYFFDGIDRRIAAVRHLRVDGQGKNPIDTSNPANPDGLIVTDYDWDANSRIVAMADDGSMSGDQNTSIGVIETTNVRGNVTRYIYDDLNRQVRELFDDGTINDYSFDADDNLARRIDENGSLVNNTYDGINRLIRRDVTRAASNAMHPAGGFKDQSIAWQVIGTTLQQFEYDGLSRMARSFDNNDPDDPNDDAVVRLAFDSLNRRLEDVQNGRAVSGRWMGDNNRIGLIYSNGRELAFTFDKLDRIDQITNHESIVDYDFIGPGRVLERTYSNGVRLTYLDNARQQVVGYDGMRRVIEHRHLRADNSLVAGFAYDYDREEHRLFEIKQHMGNLREDYAYDSLYRLESFIRPGEPADNWRLDGANNWVRRQGATNQVNNLNEYASFDGVSQLHDDNGNVIDDETFLYQYDFANRLRRVVRKADNTVVAVYRYDAHGRRTERIVTHTGLFDDRVQYLYDGRRVIEERRVGYTQQYVYGRWIDEPLTLDLDMNNDAIPDQTFFYHQDGKTYVAALTDASGQVVEEVAYDAYGRPSLDMSLVGNPYLFTGRRYDPETGLYYYRARYYDPMRGRFLQRDPIGMWTDVINLGSGYAFVGNDAVNGRDPSGLGPGDPFKELDADFSLGGQDEPTPGPGDPFKGIDALGFMPGENDVQVRGPGDPYKCLDCNGVWPGGLGPSGFEPGPGDPYKGLDDSGIVPCRPGAVPGPGDPFKGIDGGFWLGGQANPIPGPGDPFKGIDGGFWLGGQANPIPGPGDPFKGIDGGFWLGGQANPIPGPGDPFKGIEIRFVDKGKK